MRVVIKFGWLEKALKKVKENKKLQQTSIKLPEIFEGVNVTDIAIGLVVAGIVGGTGLTIINELDDVTNSFNSTISIPNSYSNSTTDIYLSEFVNDVMPMIIIVSIAAIILSLIITIFGGFRRGLI